ncbi:MAG: hypothetical protein JWP01_119 [Myxococcales bacterium]|nr:hypothetical protein [Myxococcales bacterium]
MQRPLALFLLLTAAACGDDGSSGPDAQGPDGNNHPPNPSGLGPAPVALGSSTDTTAAGSYAIIAKTGITNVTGSLITGGNLGLSPAAASFVTGFAPVADASGMFATSVAVAPPGKIYASNYTAPTPSNLTTAVLAMQTAYTDAAGRSDPDFVNFHSGDLGGQTLAPGVYKFGTGVTIPTDVTFSGGANDTWILQVSNDVDLSASKRVILAGGADAKNIVWQVAGKVTVHANAHLEGVVLCKTGITLQTMATVRGRLFAQTLVAIDNNAITVP